MKLSAVTQTDFESMKKVSSSLDGEQERELEKELEEEHEVERLPPATPDTHQKAHSNPT